jgi:hypothetical protein
VGIIQGLIIEDGLPKGLFIICEISKFNIYYLKFMAQKSVAFCNFKPELGNLPLNELGTY